MTFTYFAVGYVLLVVASYLVITRVLKLESHEDPAIDAGVQFASLMLAMALALSLTTLAIVIHSFLKG